MHISNRIRKTTTAHRGNWPHECSRKEGFFFIKHTAFISSTLQEYSCLPEHNPDSPQSRRGARKETYKMRAGQFLLSVDTQGRWRASQSHNQGKMRQSRNDVLIYATTLIRREKDEHHTTTLAHTRVSTKITNDTMFRRKKKSTKQHWNNFAGCEMPYCVRARTMIANQVRIIRQYRKRGTGKYAAAFNTLPPWWKPGV